MAIKRQGKVISSLRLASAPVLFPLALASAGGRALGSTCSGSDDSDSRRP